MSINLLFSIPLYFYSLLQKSIMPKVKHKAKPSRKRKLETESSDEVLYLYLIEHINSTIYYCPEQIYHYWCR